MSTTSNPTPPQRLQAWIHQQGINRTQAANRLQCGASAITRILAETQFPSLAIAEAIERATEGEIKAVEWGVYQRQKRDAERRAKTGTEG